MMQVVVNQRNHLGVVYMCADASAVSADHNSGASSCTIAQPVNGVVRERTNHVERECCDVKMTMMMKMMMMMLCSCVNVSLSQVTVCLMVTSPMMVGCVAVDGCSVLSCCVLIVDLTLQVQVHTSASHFRFTVQLQTSASHSTVLTL
jgi:hypothetical protein